MKKIFKKLAAALVAFVTVFSTVPIASAAVASDLPADMADHAILRALEYTGYDVQRQKDDGTLYQPGSYAGAAPESVRSNISYGLNRSGKETVADSSTVTGFAPDIARFEKDGLCCASFVTYFLCNYLPNIEGSDTQFIIDEINATGMNSQAVVTWRTAMDRLVTKGKVEKIGTSSANVDRTKLTPGDVIIFGSASNANVHVAIYSGTYKGQDFIIHVGTPRGPEITLVTNMAAAGDKSSTPNAYYHFKDPIFEQNGDIEVYKKDTNGKNLSGAVFVATDTKTGDIYRIGPTNSSGYAKTPYQIPFGTYTVKETVFPVGYHAYGQTEWTVTLDASNKGLVTINAVNEEDEGGVRITKVSEDGKVEGVRFTISGNGINQTVTTGKNGDITVEGLKPGTYQIVEHSEEQYIPHEAHTFTVVSNQTTTVSFSNTLKRGSLKVTKTAEDGLVEGVRFRLYGTSLSGREVNVFATADRNGIAIFPDILISGNMPYTLEEVDTAEKYIVPAAQEVTIEWNKSLNKTVHNSLKRGSLTVTKTSEDGFVEGVRFRLHGTSLSGAKVDEYATTDRTGKATFANILIGSNYTLEEVNIQNFYVVPASQSAIIEWNKVTNKTFHNALKRGSLTVTKTSEDGLVAGMRFHLSGTSLSGAKVDEYATTDRTGKATFSNILIGSNYTLEEVNIQSRYVVPASQSAVIEWDKVTNKSFHNALKRGSLTVTKTSEDGLVAGIRFHLFGTSLSGAKVDEYATSDRTGKATFSNILIGFNYTIEEDNIQDRYVVPQKQTAPILWNEVTNRSFTNTLKKFTVSVTKRDKETGTAQGNATLAGARYGIYKGGELVDTYTINENGQFVTKEYICGENWTIKELEPSEGYLLDTTVYHVGAEARRYTLEHNSTANAVTEQVSKGKIAVIKHTDNGTTQIETPEKGAAFEVFLKSSGSYGNAKESERDVLICDENGFAQTKSLPYGVYTVKQTNGWDGRELMKPFDVFVSKDGEIYRYLINNAFFEGYLKIVKTDAETGKVIPYAGAGFQIYDPDGSLVTMTFTYPTPAVVDTFYTGTDGSLVTPEKLPYGKGYSIVEVQAPYGYVLDGTPIIFDINQEYSTEESGVTVIKVNKNNLAQKGTITVTKDGEVFYGVSVSGGETGELIYQPVYQDMPLAGAVFEIKAAEDVITLDGTLRYAKGDVVAEITTGPDGTAVTEPLYLGKFEIRETTAPDDMVLNEKIHTVELVYAEQDVTITETATSFYNDRQKAALSFQKVLESNELFGIGNNNEIQNVVFGLYAAEELISASGTSIPADGLIEIINLDENGVGRMKTDLPLGRYYIKELVSDEHYILSDEKYPVAFDYAGQEIAVVEITANSGEAIENRLAYGTIKGLKIDRETTETIAGALFGLFRPDEIRFTEETAILTATSQEDGIFTFENVPVGSWVICELAPAEGFLPSPTLHHVQVDADEQVIEITVINSRVPEIGTTATVGNEKEICATEIFTLLDVVAYQHLIPGKEYTIKGVLMDKATGKPLLINGEEIHAETVFTPEQPEGIAVVEFTFDSRAIHVDTEIVVFESLYDGCKELALHEDLEDENQTVAIKIPKICTNAAIDDKKEGTASGMMTVADIVTYENLTPDKEYTVKGILMDKATEKPFLVNGAEIHAETTFIPDAPEGETIVEFTFDATAIKTDTEIVVFESLYREGVEIAAHTDLEDESQTIAIKIPKISTNASIDGKKEGVASGNVTLTDIVTYENLTPGKEYTVIGILMDKATGKPFLVNGEEIHAETVFIPDASEGEAIVEFTFDATAIKTDTEIVVFETLYREGVEIAVHADLEDENQTVTVTPSAPPVPDKPHIPDTPQTGDSSRLGVIFAGLGLSAAGIGVSIFTALKKKKKEKTEKWN